MRSAASKRGNADQRQAVLAELRILSQSNPASLPRVRELVNGLQRETHQKHKDAIGRLAQSDKVSSEQFPTTVPWPQPVDGAALFNEIKSLLKRLVVADDETYAITTLWIIHTWLIDDLETRVHTP